MPLNNLYNCQNKHCEVLVSCSGAQDKRLNKHFEGSCELLSKQCYVMFIMVISISQTAFFPLYISLTCNFCTLYIPFTCNFCPLYVPFTCNICPLYIPFTCNVCPLYIPLTCNVWPLHFQSCLTFSKRNIQDRTLSICLKECTGQNINYLLKGMYRTDHYIAVYGMLPSYFYFTAAFLAAIGQLQKC